MKYDIKYPQILAEARNIDGVVKSILEGECVCCGERTGWSTLMGVWVCSENCNRKEV